MTDELKCQICGRWFFFSVEKEHQSIPPHKCSPQGPMTERVIPPLPRETGEMSDKINEMWRLEDRLNNEGRCTAFIADKVSLHGHYTAEDLFEIWKLLKPELIATLEARDNDRT